MRFWKHIDKWLLFITILLFAIGTIMIFSASNVSFYMRYASSPYRFLFRQIMILGFGFIISCVIVFVNIKTTSNVSSLITTGLMISLPLLFFFGVESNGAKSWFDLGVFNFQPSEFLKIFIIVWLAKYYDNRDNLTSYGKSLFPIFICVIAFIAIALQPDLGTALIFASIVGITFLLSPVDKKIKMRIVKVVGGFAVVGILILVVAGKSILSPRQMARITSVFHSSPCSEASYYTDGNQVCNGYIAINNGGLMGRGLGNSIQKYLYLPEAHTDFIFCIIIEELGLWFGIFIIVLYMVLLYRIIKIGRRSLNNRDALICYGCAFYIFVHIAVNLLGIFGLIPMTGVPLPFMSYGGSYTWCLMFALAIVERINYETSVVKEKEMLGNQKRKK